MIATAVEAFLTCCKAVSPYAAIRNAIRLEGNSLRIGPAAVERNERTRVTEHDTEPCVNTASQVVLVGFGKAVVPMVVAAEEALGDALESGVAIAPAGGRSHSVFFTPRTEMLEAASGNLPDAASLAATIRVVERIRECDSPDTVFLFLISGGGSALLCSPTEGVSLDDKLHTIRALTSRGASIEQLNAVRQQLSWVKGGRLLAEIRKGRAVSLIVSDIIGDPVHLIASGPTVPPQATVSDPMEVVRELGAEDELRPNVLRILQTRVDPPGPFCRNEYEIVSSNVAALAAAAQRAAGSGYTPVVVTNSLRGNATVVGEALADIALAPNREELAERLAKLVPEVRGVSLPNAHRIALVFGGETTVIVRGKGKGGRNQELALAALLRAHDSAKLNKPQHRFAVLSCGTDGQDGPTDAAGACFDSTFLDKVCADSARARLLDSDSFSFWTDFVGGPCHVKTGPTGTNVMDVQLVLLQYS